MVQVKVEMGILNLQAGNNDIDHYGEFFNKKEHTKQYSIDQVNFTHSSEWMNT